MFVEEHLAGYEGATSQIQLFHNRQCKPSIIVNNCIPSPSAVTWRCFELKLKYISSKVQQMN